MVHLITSKDTFGFTGDRSQIWHGLGKELPQKMKAVEAFPYLGLDWETELAPVYAEFNGQRIALSEHRAHIRKDTGDLLGMVSDGYKPLDNGDLARFADSLVEAFPEAYVDTASSLLGGKRVFVSLKMPEEIQVVRGDTLRIYLVASNGHGGFAGTNIYPTSIRPVCNNTLTWSEKDLGQGVRFAHTGDLAAKMAQAKMVLGLALRETERFKEQVMAMANADLTTGQIKDFMDLAFVSTFGKAPDAERDGEAFERWTARRTEMVNHWLMLLENERQTIAGIQGTAWAALNAYTEWSDHERGGAWMDNRTADHRIHSNLFGTAAVAKRKVLKAALALSK